MLLKGVNASVSHSINFDINPAVVSAHAQSQINEISDALLSSEPSGKTLLIEGHTHNTGNAS